MHTVERGISRRSLSYKRSQSRHIDTAAAKGLGVGELSRIDVTTIRV